MCVCLECAWSVYVCMLGVCLECVCAQTLMQSPFHLYFSLRLEHSTHTPMLYTLPFIIQKPAVFQGPVAQAAIPLAVSISLYIYTQPSSLQVLIGRQEGR